MSIRKLSVAGSKKHIWNHPSDSQKSPRLRVGNGAVGLKWVRSLRGWTARKQEAWGDADPLFQRDLPDSPVLKESSIPVKTGPV